MNVLKCVESGFKITRGHLLVLVSGEKRICEPISLLVLEKIPLSDRVTQETTETEGQVDIYDVEDVEYDDSLTGYPEAAEITVGDWIFGLTDGAARIWLPRAMAMLDEHSRHQSE